MPKVGIYTRAGVFKGLGAADVGADISGTAQKLINAYATALEGELGSLAFKDMVETAQLGSTVIQGGYIKTDLINAQAIAAQEAFITKLLAQEAFINQLATNTAFINSLVARTIKTNTDGRRVEIDPVVSSVELYDQYGRQVVMLYDGSGGDGYDAKAKVINPLKRSIFGELLSDRVVFRDLSIDGAYGAFSYNGITLPSTATMDMPGVLAKCRIGADKFISKHWGRAIVKVVYLENQAANYRIIHNWEFNGYTTMATPYGIGGDGRGIIKVDVIDETSTYIDIRVSDSTNGYLLRGSFNLLIVGANG